MLQKIDIDLKGLDEEDLASHVVFDTESYHLTSLNP
jgi:hypothetical protein